MARWTSAAPADFRSWGDFPLKSLPTGVEGSLWTQWITSHLQPAGAAGELRYWSQANWFDDMKGWLISHGSKRGENYLACERLTNEWIIPAQRRKERKPIKVLLLFLYLFFSVNLFFFQTSTHNLLLICFAGHALSHIRRGLLSPKEWHMDFGITCKEQQQQVAHCLIPKLTTPASVALWKSFKSITAARLSPSRREKAA